MELTEHSADISTVLKLYFMYVVLGLLHISSYLVEKWF